MQLHLHEPAAPPVSPTFLAKAAIWRDHSAGMISLAEAQARSAALDNPPPPAPARQLRLHMPRRAVTPRPRHDRPAPRSSDQYANPMATTAARDDRLTPNAKALLQIIRARCGKGRTTSTCKATLANIMSRSPRTIARYLRDLTRWGYLEVATRRGRSGLDTGLLLKITEAVLPFFAKPSGLARWLAQKVELPAFVPALAGVTELSPINPTINIFSMRGQEKALEGSGAIIRRTG